MRLSAAAILMLCVLPAWSVAGAADPAPARPAATASPTAETGPAANAAPSAAGAEAPVNVLGAGALERWTVLGPFPNSPNANTARRAGFETDYLSALGGEKHAVLTTGLRLEDPARPGEGPVVLAASAPGGTLDFQEYFPNADYRVAYAFAYLDSPRAQTVDCFLGSDDAPRVWVNQDLVWDRWTSGRGLRAREDHFQVRLVKGLNRILVKIDQGWGDWQFVLEVFDPEGMVALAAERQVADQLKAFQAQELRPVGREGFLIEPGPFPEIGWSDPAAVEKLVGAFPLQVRWFDARLREVKSAEKPGRYLAYIQGECPIGFTVRRSLTFFCRPAGETPGRITAQVALETPDDRVRQRWQQQAALLGTAATEAFNGYLAGTARGAALLAFLESPEAAATPAPGLADKQAEIQDAELHLALKRRLLDLPAKGRTLKPPQALKPRAPVLRTGTPKEAGVRPDAARAIHKACQAWFEDDHQPFSVLVARRGVIVAHEAFGPGVTPATPFEIASIAKSLTGALFAEFMDQDLLSPDDVLGRYSPDFPLSGERALTLRQCFTHTTGLDGWERWGDVANPWLDNVVANGLGFLHPGRQFIYGNTSHQLAGKIMELAGRKSIWRLFAENLFQPLGMTHTEMHSLAGWTRSTAEDVARFGQMLLNRGAYGDRRFFSPAVYEQILPRRLREFYPAVAASCGIGLEWMRTADPRAGRNGVPADKTLLGPRTFGHGAGTGSVFRVDPEHEWVVVLLRNQVGENYDRHLAEFLTAVESGLAENPEPAPAAASEKRPPRRRRDPGAAKGK